MAASGIQEHNEARRKERVLMKKANWEKMVQDGRQPLYAPQQQSNYLYGKPSDQSGTSYERELISRRVGSPPGIDVGHDAKSVDRQRRMDHYNRQQSEYSAKVKGRYNNFDYQSQW